MCSAKSLSLSLPLYRLLIQCFCWLEGQKPSKLIKNKKKTQSENCCLLFLEFCPRFPLLQQIRFIHHKSANRNEAEANGEENEEKLSGKQQVAAFKSFRCKSRSSERGPEGKKSGGGGGNQFEEITEFYGFVLSLGHFLFVQYSNRPKTVFEMLGWLQSDRPRARAYYNSPFSAIQGTCKIAQSPNAIVCVSPERVWSTCIWMYRVQRTICNSCKPNCICCCFLFIMPTMVSMLSE